MHAVEQWFGSGFAALDQRLQDLHRKGGTLRGRVTIEYGNGLAGWIGRRMAIRSGVPPDAGSVDVAVTIRSDHQRLYWDRVFCGKSRAASVFTPVGNWPDGHWIEETGLLRLYLKVEVDDGGWRWLPFKCWLAGIPLSRAFMPKVAARKFIENDLYRFAVSVSLPVLGFVFSYGGMLSCDESKPTAGR